MDIQNPQNYLNVPLVNKNRISQTEMQLSLRNNYLSLQGPRTARPSAINYYATPTLVQSNINASSIAKSTANEIDQDVILNVKQLYSDDKLLKRYQVETRKPHKKLQCFKNIPSISPENRLLVAWKLYIFILTLIYFFELPVYILISPQIFEFLGWFALNTMGGISLISFLIDMFLEFQTAYFVHGNPVYKKSKIAQNYLNTYFTYDLIADIAFGVKIFTYNADYKWIYFLFFFKMPSLFKIDTHFEEILLLHRRARLTHLILRILIVLFCCINLYCCIFYWIGVQSINHGLNSWLTNSGNFGVIYQLEHYQQYFYSFYFSLGTLTSTMGYGDITPFNMFECGWALVGMMFGIMIFIFNMNVIYDIVQKHNELKRSMIKDKIAIHRFMRDKNITPITKSRINQYLNEFWYAEGAREFYAEQRILTWLGPELKKQLLYEAYIPFIGKVIQFQNFSQQFLKDLTQYVGEVRLSKGESVIRDKERVLQKDQREFQNQSDLVSQAKNTLQSTIMIDEESLYYVQNGHVIVHPNINNNNTVLQKLKDGTIFGEISFFSGLPRQASVTTSSYAHLYVLTRTDFLETLKNYPKDYELYCMLRDQARLNLKLNPVLNPKNLQSICFTCGQLGHLSTLCPKSHYIPDYDSIIELEEDLNQQRRRIRRKGKMVKWQTLKQTTQNQIIVEKLLSNQNKQKDNKLRRQTSMLMSTPYPQQQRSESEVEVQEFVNQLDAPMNYSFFFPDHNISSIVETYNRAQESTNYRMSQVINYNRTSKVWDFSDQNYRRV